LQGGGTAGGLGLDREFFESVLVPQVMLYGFLGFEPTFDGFSISPRLPKDWPELIVTRIHLHEHVLDVTADAAGGIKISGVGPKREELVVHVPANVRLSAVGVNARAVTSP
jgi:cellobiose phosphorylase